jgi:EAL domain-containing protein (putative c-di-GMP-specific phosphodiesterase class I)
LKLAEHLRKPVGVPELRARLRTLASSAAAVSRSALECAVANHEMVLLYQPKVALARDACEAAATELRAGGERWPLVGLEALVRWQRSAGEVLTPERFLPLAEASNLIKPLTLVVVRIAMAQMAAWAESGFRPVVALNLSGRLFDDLALPDELAALTAEFRVAPGQVVFEITETAAMADAAACLEVTTRLRLKGFSLSIDDFGTGYSSLVQLYRMPFSELKIDRSFVADMTASEEARTIVQSIIELARGLSMTACAEGVENRETSELLTGLGCARAQGYFFGRPLAAEALLDMMVHSRG